jgi:aryl-alcohol dehydrogenase
MRATAALFERSLVSLSRYPKVKLAKIELDEPQAHEVLVKISSCGICGTDHEVLNGDLPTGKPCVLGHEGAGIIEAIGSKVSQFKVGDRVLISFPSCGTCRNCLRDQPRYCELAGPLSFGFQRLDGSHAIKKANGGKLYGNFFQQSSWSTHAITTERNLIKVPDSIDLDLMGPLGCSITTGAGAVLNELQPQAGSSIAIFGGGSTGLAAVMAAVVRECETIIVVDPNSNRLKLAKKLGATHVFKSEKEAIAAKIRLLTKNRLDYSLDCTLGGKMVPAAMESLGILGVCGMVGGGSPLQTFTLNHADTLYGKRLIGIVGGGGKTPDAHQHIMQLHEQGKFPLEKLVKFYPFKKINDAIRDSLSGKVVKPILKMN